MNYKTNLNINVNILTIQSHKIQRNYIDYKRPKYFCRCYGYILCKHQNNSIYTSILDIMDKVPTFIYIYFSWQASKTKGSL